jgi:hypothetical protein
MVKIKIWGPITWNLLHTITEKIYDDRFIYAKIDVVNIILLILQNIPCPICREHAETFIKKHNINLCNSRDELINYIFNFHNESNRHAENPIFGKNVLTKYKTFNFNVIVNEYMKYYKNVRSDDLKFSFSKSQNLKTIFSLLVKNTNNFTY